MRSQGEECRKGARVDDHCSPRPGRKARLFHAQTDCGSTRATLCSVEAVKWCRAIRKDLPDKGRMFQHTHQFARRGHCPDEDACRGAGADSGIPPALPVATGGDARVAVVPGRRRAHPLRLVRSNRLPPGSEIAPAGSAAGPRGAQRPFQHVSDPMPVCGMPAGDPADSLRGSSGPGTAAGAGRRDSAPPVARPGFLVAPRQSSFTIVSRPRLLVNRELLLLPNRSR